LRLKDILEEEVDEKYYLSSKMIEGFIKHNENHSAKGTGFLFQPKDGGGDCKLYKSKCGSLPNG
jgi:DNA (cytosine-5)-methyltransferase 1